MESPLTKRSFPASRMCWLAEGLLFSIEQERAVHGELRRMLRLGFVCRRRPADASKVNVAIGMDLDLEPGTHVLSRCL